jgi:hypothetical protein
MYTYIFRFIKNYLINFLLKHNGRLQQLTSCLCPEIMLIGSGASMSFHLHSTRFEPMTFIWISQGPRMSYTSE